MLVARQKDGKPLESTGPFQIVDTKSTVHGRWVRQVARILVQRVGAVPVQGMKDAAVADGLPGHGGLLPCRPRPGPAPGLVTLRARQILASADRVICFHWLKEQVATLTDPDKIVVASPYLMGGRYLGIDPAKFEGKQRQEVAEANAAMSAFNADVRRLAGEGKTVAIVAAGDPTIYCPWGWIPEHLADPEPHGDSPVSVPSTRQTLPSSTGPWVPATSCCRMATTWPPATRTVG